MSGEFLAGRHPQITLAQGLLLARSAGAMPLTWLLAMQCNAVQYDKVASAAAESALLAELLTHGHTTNSTPISTAIVELPRYHVDFS